MCFWKELLHSAHPMSLDTLSRAYFTLELKSVYCDRTGGEFQNFFSDLMCRRYPSDFVRVTTWGSKGDMKNDGYLRSERKLFGVYAPQELQLKRTTTKIRKDFIGAVEQWSQHFDEWVFVHNSLRGLPAPILRQLLDLESEHGKLAREWGYDVVSLLMFQLSRNELCELLGTPSPTLRDYLDMSFEDISEVVSALADADPPKAGPIAPVPEEKMEKVGLAPSSKLFLGLGLQRSNRVRDYFHSHVDPLKGERIAAAFKERFRQLAAIEPDPDVIVLDLRDHALGIGSRTPAHEVAAWSVLAYLFERCDIFTIEEQVVS
jgi:hypothetical protein